eukprot:CAMPEP_0176229436 /NCGR_PEP_ID=MMETSP0121_2-20121125/23787_1 /TAXON_ID=160619 /ORGANISM="Kryptoperidinium foliaceum, Strain CCMP 1326" /LENGTH=57 /DNA_ID=CAMNT_0017568757 /DNA_START=48 /DNA_END=218 /DNA_ORIENTATION=+
MGPPAVQRAARAALECDPRADLHGQREGAEARARPCARARVSRRQRVGWKPPVAPPP